MVRAPRTAALTLSASLRLLVRSAILGLPLKLSRSISPSSMMLPLAPPPVHAEAPHRLASKTIPCCCNQTKRLHGACRLSA